MGIRTKSDRLWMEIDQWSSHVAGRVRSGMQLLCLVIKEDIIKEMVGMSMWQLFKGCVNVRNRMKECSKKEIR